MDITPGIKTSEGKGTAVTAFVTLVTTLASILTATGVIKVDDQAVLISAAVAVFSGIQGAIVLVMYIKSRTDIKVASLNRGEVG